MFKKWKYGSCNFLQIISQDRIHLFLPIGESGKHLLPTGSRFVLEDLPFYPISTFQKIHPENTSKKYSQKIQPENTSRKYSQKNIQICIEGPTILSKSILYRKYFQIHFILVTLTLFLRWKWKTEKRKESSKNFDPTVEKFEISVLIPFLAADLFPKLLELVLGKGSGTWINTLKGFFSRRHKWGLRLSRGSQTRVFWVSERSKVEWRWLVTDMKSILLVSIL